MKRREFFKVVAGTASSWPLFAQAQQQAMPVVGYADGVSVTTLPTASLLAGVRRSLAASGFIEGKDFRFEFREAKGELSRLSDLYRELADQKVKVLLAPTTIQLEAARSVTRSVPIIFQTGSDPVENGFVASMNRPGGNLTGVFNLAAATTGKRVEVLRELVPALTKFVFLTYRQDVRLSQNETKAAQDAADFVSLDLLVLALPTSRSWRRRLRPVFARAQAASWSVRMRAFIV